MAKSFILDYARPKDTAVCDRRVSLLSIWDFESSLGSTVNTSPAFTTSYNLYLNGHHLL